ncbi:MAG: hypothetical protein ABW213_08245 [Tardiphaga sp.]
MSGDIIVNRRAPIGASLLLGWSILAGVPMREVSAEEAAPAAARAVDDENRPGAGDLTSLSGPKKPEPETAAREPEPPPSSARGNGVPSPKVEPSRQESKDAAKNSGKSLAVPQLVLSADVARKIGQKIWLNETGGKVDAITAWNANEDFASLGIGHFIWFPLGKWLPFEESFPSLLEFMRKKNAHLPGWLNQPQIPANPWTSRAEFKKNFNSPQMRELRQFLLDTVAEQTQFLVARAQGAMEKILKNTPDATEREHIVAQFSRVVRGCEDLYPLIDYINFKGEGTNPNEAAADKQTGQRQGWGLKQVLLTMNGDSTDPKSVRAAFADAVQAVLQRRIRNLPANRVFEVGWLRRADTYRRPIAEVEHSTTTGSARLTAK